VKAARILTAGAALVAGLFGAAVAPSAAHEGGAGAALASQGPARSALAVEQAVEDAVELRFVPQLGISTRFQQSHTTTSQIVGITDVINGAERPMAELPPMRWEVVETLDWRDKGAVRVLERAPAGGSSVAHMVERDFERLTRARRERAGESVDSTLELGALQGSTVLLEETGHGWDASYVAEVAEAATPEGGGERGDEVDRRTDRDRGTDQERGTDRERRTDRDRGTDQDKGTDKDKGTDEEQDLDQGTGTESAAEQGPDPDRDPAWLVGIEYLPPFAGFLPDAGAAVVGDTWEADLDAWRAVLRPTGELVYLDESGAVVDDSIDTELLSTLKGTIECTLTGVQGDTATIAVQVRVTSRKQVEGPLERDDAGIETASFQRSIRLRGAYDGTLVWDTTLSRARSFDLTGKATWNIDETTLMTFENGTEWAQGKLMELSADHTLTTTVD